MKRFRYNSLRHLYYDVLPEEYIDFVFSHSVDMVINGRTDEFLNYVRRLGSRHGHHEKMTNTFSILVEMMMKKLPRYRPYTSWLIHEVIREPVCPD